MMWRVLVALCVSFAVVHGSAKYCCIPDQLQGTQAGTIGMVNDQKGETINIFAKFAYDFTGQRMATNISTTTGGKETSYRTISDYTKDIAYRIEGTTCTTSPLQGPMQRSCVPDSATVNGYVYYGIGSSTLPGISYTVPEQEGLMATVVVAPETCAPVVEAIYGTFQGTPIMETFGFINMTLGIKDPSMFVPPSFCNQKYLQPKEQSSSVHSMGTKTLRSTFFGPFL